MPSGLRAIVSEIIGGMTQTTVKKENGARLLMSFLLSVDAQPIGRGTTAPREESINLTLFDACRIEFEKIGHLDRSHSPYRQSGGAKKYRGAATVRNW